VAFARAAHDAHEVDLTTFGRSTGPAVAAHDVDHRAFSLALTDLVHLSLNQREALRFMRDRTFSVRERFALEKTKPGVVNPAFEEKGGKTSHCLRTVILTRPRLLGTVLESVQLV
jgi:hypothetical protein